MTAPQVTPAPQAAPDATNPDHYRLGPVEVIQISRHLNSNRGQALQYIARAGRKGPPEQELEDIRKAIWFLEDEIQRMTGKGTHAP